ncbi:hypothetical protein [Rhizobium sp. RAF56]|jgi:predicted nucleotidyltransferase|uniref:hypothetical protein n=1 Tax=Rhizobium sp. RAF56 TaxID=3233062 RepID=UPI003F9C1B57
MRSSEVLEKNRQAIREATTRFKAANPRVGLLEELQELMDGTGIHLLTPGDLPERIRGRVLREAKPI